MAQTHCGGGNPTNRKDVETEVNKAFDTTIQNAEKKHLNLSITPMSTKTVAPPSVKEVAPQLSVSSHRDKAQKRRSSKGITPPKLAQKNIAPVVDLFKDTPETLEIDDNAFLRGYYEDDQDMLQEIEHTDQTKNSSLWDDYFRMAMLPDTPVAGFVYNLGNRKTRTGGVMVGSGMDYIGQFLSAAGALTEGIAEYFPAYGPYHNEIVGFNPSAYIPERDKTLITKYVSDPLREKGTDLSQEGQSMVDMQKEGLGKFGRFAVDLGSAATQTLLDVGTTVVTGGSMAIPAAIRSFGGSAAEAAADGAELDQQMLYAASSAAATYGIEQLCNTAFTGLKIIAPGISDDFLATGVEKLAQKLAGTRAGAEALKNIGMLIASGISEGVEETLESLLSPFLQRLTYNKEEKTVFQNPDLLADAAYEGLIAGILGVFGSGTNTAIDLVENLIYDGVMPGEKLLASTIIKRSTVKMQSGFSCFPDGDPLNGYVQNVEPEEGYFDAAMHGTSTMVGFGTTTMNMSPRLLASVIRHSEGYHGQNVRLLSCCTGKIVDGEYCFAEELANALGVEVSAPNDTLFIFKSGAFRIGKRGDGSFVSFKPNQRRRFR